VNLLVVANAQRESKRWQAKVLANIAEPLGAEVGSEAKRLN